MKNYKLIPLFTILVLFSFCFQIYAQNADEQAKRDEIEVTKFADTFLDSFIETQDIEKIPQTFFDSGFKNRFIKDSDLEVLFKVEGEKIFEQESAERIVTFHNFFNLLMLASTSCPDKEKNENLSDSEVYLKCFPPQIYNKIKQSKWLKVFADDNDDNDNGEADKDPQSTSDFAQFFEEMNKLSADLRIYFKDNPPQKSKDFQKIKEKFFKYYPAENCEGEKCLSFPEKTPIFAVHQIGMCLRIAKIEGQWKIVQIYSIASED